ncbi:hypothetical protein EGT74_17375 [Chitinophaga lutea]|uniref:Tetratricopeptide repeat protein n=1 Tax=Chitinophaga lutea TaxID=2488634 RepID=A0A3N4PUS1_9BACT|nr:hypothetical protein [Chitinophaga lutea]RPE08801.1 hypothetical protein EGT74_17375 [Chitinophaga lutea]
MFRKIHFVLVPLIAASLQLQAQAVVPKNKVLYVVDSVPVGTGHDLRRELPYEELKSEAIASVNILKYPETLQHAKYRPYDSVLFIITKAYAARPAELKAIPSTDQLTRKGNIYFYKGKPYSGKVLDYHYDGSIYHEGTLENGKYTGVHLYHDPEGLRRHSYTYDKDGAEHNTGTDTNGNMTSRVVRTDERLLLFELYYPNGQLKHRTKRVKNKEIQTSYYSSGLLSDSLVRHLKTNKTYYDPQRQLLRKLAEQKDYLKLRELFPSDPATYMYISAHKRQDGQFDEALRYMDTCIALEPLEPMYNYERAMLRLRKFAYAADKVTFKWDYELSRYLDKKPELHIPEADKQKIMADLKLFEPMKYTNRDFVKVYRYVAEKF